MKVALSNPKTRLARGMVGKGKIMKKILALVAGGLFATMGSANALILSVDMGTASNVGGTASIIAAPASVADDAPGAENRAQQGFNERQGVVVGAGGLAVDGGTIAAGTLVSSHMIFLNSSGSLEITHRLIDWVFDGTILGVMSDQGGTLEAGSSAALGNPGTFYPGALGDPGLESNNVNGNNDGYSFSGNTPTVTLSVL